MSLWKIAWRSLRQRPLSSTLTCVAMALGVALVTAVLVVHYVVEQSFQRNTAVGYHMVVGGKNGSKMELILSTVYHVGVADEPLPYLYYKEFIISTDADGHEHRGRFADFVERAVPICLGDNYEGYRVVGTTPEMFDFVYAGDQKYEFSAGVVFKSSEYFTAVVGAEASRKTGLKVGDDFMPTHGVDESEAGHVHHDKFCIVGVLAPTGTPNDRAIFINIEGFYLLEGHAKPGATAAKKQNDDAQEHHDDGHDHPENRGGDEKSPVDDKDDHAEHGHDEHDHAGHDHAGHDHGSHDHHEPLPESQREVTAILVLASMTYGEAMADGIAGQLMQSINEGSDAQAAVPLTEIQTLLTQFVDPLRWILLGLTILTVLVAGVGVMVGIYNSMTGRRHEIAVLRALGAGRSAVMFIVLLESIMLSIIGGFFGAVLGHAIVGVAAVYLVDYTGVAVGPLQFSPWEAVVVPALLVLAALVGYLPALAAYRTDVVKGLAARE
jgi:putative ABC transport system permease protein